MPQFKSIHGIVPVTATPYDEDGSVDYDSIRAFVDYAIGKGIHGLATIGGAGRFWQLTDSERQLILRTTVEQVAGRVPVVCGVAGPSIENAVLYTQMAQAEGADAVFAMPPYVRSLAPSEIYEYYAAISRVAEVPVIVQDIVMHSEPPVPTATLAQIAHDLEAVEYIKTESPEGNTKVTSIVRACGDAVKVLTGTGGLGFLDALNRGCVGCMPGPVNLGGLVRCYEAYMSGDIAAAQRWYEAVLPLIVLRMRNGNITKEILRRNGVFRTTYERPPRGGAVDEFLHKQLDLQFEVHRELF